MMLDDLEQLSARLLEKASSLNESIAVTQTSDLYVDQRDEWKWYLKGQQQALTEAALQIQSIVIHERINLHITESQKGKE